MAVRLLDSASAIANLSFTRPSLSSTSHSLSCRINYWGGLTIYTPNLLDSEIAELIKVLEKLVQDRKGRELSPDEINRYMKVARAIRLTIGLQGKVDEVYLRTG